MIGWLISKVYYAIFSGEEKNLKNSHLIVKIAFAVLSLFTVLRGTTFSVTTILIIFLIWIFREKWYTVASALILSLIPAAWFSVTGGIFYYFLYEEPVLNVFSSIFFKTIGISLSLVFLAYMLTPYEFSFFIWKLGLRLEAILPPFIWRVIPLTLVMVKDAYDVQKIKGEKAWKSVGISIATGIETREYIYEYNYYTLSTGIKRPFVLKHNWRETLYLSASILFLALLNIFMK